MSNLHYILALTVLTSLFLAERFNLFSLRSLYYQHINKYQTLKGKKLNYDKVLALLFVISTVYIFKIAKYTLKVFILGISESTSLWNIPISDYNLFLTIPLALITLLALVHNFSLLFTEVKPYFKYNDKVAIYLVSFDLKKYMGKETANYTATLFVKGNTKQYDFKFTKESYAISELIIGTYSKSKYLNDVLFNVLRGAVCNQTIKATVDLLSDEKALMSIKNLYEPSGSQIDDEYSLKLNNIRQKLIIISKLSTK